MKLLGLLFSFVIVPLIGSAQTKEPLNEQKVQALVELIESYESDSKSGQEIDRPTVIEKFRECYIDPDNTYNIEVISNIIENTPKGKGWKEAILEQVDEQIPHMDEDDRGELGFGIKYVPGPNIVRKIMLKLTCRDAVEKYIYDDGVSANQLIDLLKNISPKEFIGKNNEKNHSGFRPY